MHIPSLERLLLTEDEYQAARKQVQAMAYFKWENAGCPEHSALLFWNQAVLEWIEYYYVPARNCELDSTAARQRGTGPG